MPANFGKIPHDNLDRILQKIEQVRQAMLSRLRGLGAQNEDLEDCRIKFDQLNSQIQDVIRHRAEFLVNLSHELRTPLTGVMSMSRMMMDAELSDEQMEQLRIIRESSDALLEIINDAVLFSRVESGNLESPEDECNLAQVVEGCVNLANEKAKRKGSVLMTFISPEAPRMVRADPVRLRQILLHLINYLISLTQAAEIAVRVEPDATMAGGKNRYRFLVSASGLSLAGQSREKFFEPFAKTLAAIDSKQTTSGLSLAICKSLVAVMGGEIGVDSTYEDGAAFWFSVPLTEIAVESPRLSAQPDISNLKVLVVGARPGVVNMVGTYLDSWGVTSELSLTANEALRFLRQAQVMGSMFDAVICEAKVDSQDAFDFAQTIKVDPAFSSVRTILISPSGDEPTPEEQMIFWSCICGPINQSNIYDCLTDLAKAQQVRASASSAEEAKSVLSAMSQASTLSKPPQAINQTEPMGEGPLVLVVDDNALNRQVACLQLQKLGYSCLMAVNGREAIEAVQARDFLLVLMDCRMPEMDGYEATKVIRQMEAGTGKHVPIVALTAQALAGDREKCLECGMDEYLSKPVDLIRLRQILEQWSAAKSAH
jgi:polar amino acid transport system substrate-binding protein